MTPNELPAAHGQPEWSRRRAARAQSTDFQSLTQFLNDDDPHVRLGALANPATPITARLATLNSFGLSPDHDVAATATPTAETEWIRAHANSNNPNRQRLATWSQDPAVGHWLATNSSLDREVAASLVDHGDWTVRARLARVATDRRLLDRLTADPDPRVRVIMACHRHLDPSWFPTLAQDGDPRVRRALAGRSDIGDDIIQVMASDSDASIRRRVTDRPHLSYEALRVLAADDHRNVRREVARRRDLPHLVVLQLCADPDFEVARLAVTDRSLTVGQRKNVIEHGAPHAAALAFAHGDWPDSALALRTAVQLALARLPLASSSADELGTSPDVDVRAALARNSSIGPALASRLARDPETPVRRAIASNPAAPVSVLVALLDDSDDGCRSQATVNPSVPLVELERRAGNQRRLLSRVAYNHPSQTARGRVALAAQLGLPLAPTPPERASALAASAEHDWLRLAIALGNAAQVIQNPATPPDLLRASYDTIVSDRTWLDGRRLAAHPNLPADLAFELLVTDPAIGAALAARPDLSPDLTRALLATGHLTTLIHNAAAWAPDLNPPLQLGSNALVPDYGTFARRVGAPMINTWRVHTAANDPGESRVEIWTDLVGTDADEWRHLAVARSDNQQITAVLGIRTTDVAPELMLLDPNQRHSFGRHDELLEIDSFTAAAIGLLSDGDTGALTSDSALLHKRASRSVSWGCVHYLVAASFAKSHQLDLAVPEGVRGTVSRVSSSEPYCEVQAALCIRPHGGTSIAYVLDGRAHAYMVQGDDGSTRMLRRVEPLGERRPTDPAAAGTGLMDVALFTSRQMDLALATAQQFADEAARLRK